MFHTLAFLFAEMSTVNQSIQRILWVERDLAVNSKEKFFFISFTFISSLGRSVKKNLALRHVWACQVLRKEFAQSEDEFLKLQTHLRRHSMTVPKVLDIY